MLSILDLLDIDRAQGRHPCPICDSSKGLSVAPDKGDSGLAHCFACGGSWTGVQMYGALGMGSIAEGMEAFGLSDDDWSPEAKKTAQRAKQVHKRRKEQRRKKQLRWFWETYVDYMAELEAFWQACTDQEREWHDSALQHCTAPSLSAARALRHDVMRRAADEQGPAWTWRDVQRMARYLVPGELWLIERYDWLRQSGQVSAERVATKMVALLRIAHERARDEEDAVRRAECGSTEYL